MARFDFIARFYDRLNEYGEAEALADHLDVQPEHTVLDVGGGTGQVGRALSGRFARWIVVEPSAGMRREARKHGVVAVVAGVGERLPVRTSTIDRAVMVDALHHAEDQDAVFRELHRVLRPGGVGVIEEFRMDRWRVKLTCGLAERVGLFGSRFDAPEGWRRRAEAAGFEVEVVPLNWRDVHLVLRKRRKL